MWLRRCAWRCSVAQPVKASWLVDEAAPQLLGGDLQHIIDLSIGEAPGAAPQLACMSQQAPFMMSRAGQMHEKPFHYDADSCPLFLLAAIAPQHSWESVMAMGRTL